MFIICVILLTSIYFYATRKHRYWAKKNIKHDPPVPLFGNHLKKAFGMKSITQIAYEMYNKYPSEKVVGYYSGNTPELIIRDPEIIKDILSVDFSNFYTRGFGKDAKKQVLTLNLFHADGDSWKLLRQRLTPAFTSAKLKSMFPLIIKCAEKLHGLGDEIVKTGGECNVRDVMAKFTIEFIGACGLGVDMDTIKSEGSFFGKLGKTMFTRTWKDVFYFSISDIFPETAGFIRVFDKKLEDVLINMITKIFQQRNFKPTGRNDFVDLLLELSANGKITGESIEERNPDSSPKIVEIEMDLMCMIAQVFVFFGAGFETSSSSTSFTLYKLAQNPDIQMKVQKQIDEVLAKYDNKLCYDAVSELTLLDMAFKEALRMFPPLGILQRVCRKKYTIRQLGITIDPDVKIVIPVQAIQNDKQYYDNPDQYLPERWAAGEMKQKQKYIYMPFGEGPRTCIGENYYIYNYRFY